VTLGLLKTNLAELQGAYGNVSIGAA
jgi:hypothetical protein